MYKKILSKFNFFLLALLIVILVENYLSILPHPEDDYFIILGGILATIPVVINAIKASINRKITIDLLATIALTVSLIEKQWVSVAFINLMITSARIFGDYIEARATLAIKSLIKLRPTKVKIKINSRIVETKIEDVKPNDIIVIEDGDRIPIDGVVIEGEASVDESSLTGESIPVSKNVGSKVFSSTLSVSGSLLVKVEKTGKDTTLEKVIGLVEEAQLEKVDIIGIADKFTKYYILITIVGATALYFFTHNITLVLSVLLVTCADDIAVAIPMAFWAAIGYAAKKGIIIKGGNFLEGLSDIKTLVVDKTGTLTRGKIVTEEIVAFDNFTKEKVLRFAAIAESVSEHPIAKAVTSEAIKKKLVFPAPEKFEEYSGKGVIVKEKQTKIVVGKHTFLSERGVRIGEKELDKIHQYEKQGFNTVNVGVNEKIVGFIALADQVRPEAKEAISKLKDLGVNRFVMLTGDNERVALKVANAVGINEYHANLLPEDKISILKTLINHKHKLAMVGDGVNDAASLALADIGIAMGAIGSDAAIDASDISLMQDNLMKVSEAVSLSRYTKKIALENFIIWGSVNIVGLILVFGKIIGPEGAAAWNFITDFIPIGNSMRLFRHYISSSL